MMTAHSQNPSKRVIAYIDGYNLYHAMDDEGRHDLKWLDLWKLCEELIRYDSSAQLVGVYYFSAFATWKPEQYARHRTYVSALKAKGVKTILGNFKKRHRGCKRCGNEWIAHEEKESDVNIATYLINDAHKDEYDEAIVISADTDIAPAIRMVRNEFPNKPVRTVLPPGRQQVSSLINAATSKIRISFELLSKCAFSPEIIIDDKTTICIPEKYKS